MLLNIILLMATCFTGILCGASLDQSIKQLPARRKMGLRNFSEYAKAADLSNGIAWYAIIGIGSAVLTILTAIIVWKSDLKPKFSYLIYAAGIFAICHSICTSQAAPTYFKQKQTSDEKDLERIFKRFEVIQTIRSVFIVLNFASLLLALEVHYLLNII